MPETDLEVGLYVRVSTDEQNVDRQIEDAESHLEQNYPDADTTLYPDVITGTDEGHGDEYNRMWDDIADESLDVVVVHELSRLSRLGAGEIHTFIEHCLDHDTSVKDLEVGLELNLDDGIVDRAVKQMIAGIMGDLARIEHKQKLRRINSGIRTAQNAGKWTGRPPRGFVVGEDDQRLHVDAAEFLEVRDALARIDHGESKSTVAKDTDIPQSTLSRLYDEKRDLYLATNTREYDERVDAAVDEIRPLDDLKSDDDGDMEARIRAIVNEEMASED